LLEDAHVLVTSRDEVGDVTHAFNTMVVDLREKERIKETFGQYVDPRVVADLIGGGAHSSSGEKQIATLFFSDIIGFSAIAERLAPSTLVDLVNAYFSEMSQPISDNTGIIDKYIGDAIMAFWVPPFVDATKQAELACRAALEQYAKLEAFRLQVPDVIGLRRDIPLIDFRAALSTGEVVVGSVGSETARSFTVMGDTVNQASRLEAANKIYGTRLLIDHETFSRAGRAFETRQIDDIIVLGRLQSIRIYELVSLAGELDPTRRRAFDLYEEALEHYRVAKWDMAEMALQAALELSPNDGPSRTLLARIAQFRRAEPEDWTGVWSMISK
jgi:adenylate cyclase